MAMSLSAETDAQDSLLSRLSPFMSESQWTFPGIYRS
jgi:hypothetical protein